VPLRQRPRYRCAARIPGDRQIAGGGGSRHRIVRRGIPYGPPYDPLNPKDGIKRGLLGLFIVVSIKDQFEFLMSEWMNGSAFAPGIFGTTDPILGNSPEGENSFVIPRENSTSLVISHFPRLVTTRGSAYTFLTQHHRPAFHHRSPIANREIASA
jgi:hypothetical protein